MRSCRDSVVRAAVLVSNVGHVDRGLVDVNVVVDVGDLCAIYDPGVRNIDALDVPLADMIGRRVNIAWTERKPRHPNPNSCATANPRD